MNHKHKEITPLELKTIRTTLGLTLKEAGKPIIIRKRSVSANYIKRLENGLAPIPVGVQTVFAHYLMMYERLHQALEADCQKTKEKGEHFFLPVWEDYALFHTRNNLTVVDPIKWRIWQAVVKSLYMSGKVIGLVEVAEVPKCFTQTKEWLTNNYFIAHISND